MKRAIDAALQEQQEAEAYRASAQGAAERDQSRTAFDDQPDDQALATARAEFPELVSAPPLRWPRLGAGQHIDSYLSPGSAIVEGSDGTRALLESDLPLRGETPAGDRAPLDMALADQGDSFQPKSSAEPVELPKNADGELRFPDQDLGIKLADADPTDAKLSSNKVFFPNAVKDGDLVVEPAPRGAEISLVLRSPDSPSNPELSFDLPTAAELRLTNQGEAAEVIRDGKRIASVDPAAAVDAQGKPIPVSYRVEGDRLVMAVADQGDVAWPVMVDPNTHVYDNNGQSVGAGTTGFTWPGWTAASNRTPTGCPYPYAQPFYECKNSDGSLSIWGFTNVSPAYVVLDYGAFIKRARSGTYIYSFHAANMSHVMQKTWTMAGVCNSACTAWMPGHWWTPLDKATGVAKQGADADRVIAASYAGQTDYFCYDPTAAPPTTSCSLGDFMNSGLQTNNTVRWGMLATGGNPTAQPNAAIGGAATLSADNVPPKIVSATHSNPPQSGWVQSYTDTVTLRAADNNAVIDNSYTVESDLNVNGDHLTGIGLGTVSVSGPTPAGQTPPAPQSAGCGTTNVYDSCPQVLTFPGITYSAPEGVSTYTPSATDVVGNAQNGGAWTVKVDRTLPTGVFTDVPTYTNGTASITGTMTDALSGPQDAKVQYQAPGSATWVDACPRQATTSSFTCNWNTAALADGTYKVRAELRDSTGGTGPNVGYTAIANVAVDHTPPDALTDIAPAVGSHDYAAELSDDDLTETSFVQHDAGSGVAQTSLEYNTAIDGSSSGQWVSADADSATGEGEVSTFWDTTGVADGLHLVRATTTDNAGNTRQTHYQIIAAANRHPCGQNACYAGFGYGKASYGGPNFLPSDDPTPTCDLYASPPPTGSNTAGDGSAGKPYATPQRLAEALTTKAAQVPPPKTPPVGCLTQGTYFLPDNQNAGRIDNPGGRPIVIEGKPGDLAKIQGRLWLYGSKITLRDLHLDGRNLDKTSGCSYDPAPCANPSPTINGNSNILIDNEITSGGDDDPCSSRSNASLCINDHSQVATHNICVNLTQRDDGNTPTGNEIKDNTFHHCGVPTSGNEGGGGHWHAIYVSSGRKTLIANNTFYSNADRAIQLNPYAQESTVTHNTIYDNGMGIQIGSQGETCPNGSVDKCSSDNKIRQNIITDSRDGTDDPRYQSQNHSIYNIYTRSSGSGDGNPGENYGTGNEATKNCLWSTKFDGDPDHRGGFGPGSSGITFSNNTIVNPRLRDPAHGKWLPGERRCSKYGAIATYFKAYGIRDTLTTPKFAGDQAGAASWAVAGRLVGATHRFVETGVSNEAGVPDKFCKKKQFTGRWVVYVKYEVPGGTTGWQCPTTLGNNEAGVFKAVITNAKRDAVVMPGRSKPFFLNHKNSRYISGKGVLVEAFGKTSKTSGEIGGYWSGVQYLSTPANAQGQGSSWTDPDEDHTFDMTSWDYDFTYLSPDTTARPYANFCVFGPARKQGTTCP